MESLVTHFIVGGIFNAVKFSHIITSFSNHDAVGLSSNIEDCRNWDENYICPRWFSPTDSNDNCGSCYAINIAEFLSFIKNKSRENKGETGKATKVSSQWLNDCFRTGEQKGCKGGYPRKLYDDVIKRAEKYFCDAEKYPFIDDDAKCYQSKQLCDQNLPEINGRLKQQTGIVFEELEYYFILCKLPMFASMQFTEEMLAYTAQEKEIWKPYCPEEPKPNRGHAVIVLGALKMLDPKTLQEERVIVIFNNHSNWGFNGLAFLSVENAENTTIQTHATINGNDDDAIFNRCGIIDQLYALGTYQDCPIIR